MIKILLYIFDIEGKYIYKYNDPKFDVDKEDILRCINSRDMAIINDNMNKHLGYKSLQEFVEASKESDKSYTDAKLFDFRYHPSYKGTGASQFYYYFVTTYINGERIPMVFVFLLDVEEYIQLVLIYKDKVSSEDLQQSREILYKRVSHWIRAKESIRPYNLNPACVPYNISLPYHKSNPYLYSKPHMNYILVNIQDITLRSRYKRFNVYESRDIGGIYSAGYCYYIEEQIDPFLLLEARLKNEPLPDPKPKPTENIENDIVINTMMNQELIDIYESNVMRNRLTSENDIRINNSLFMVKLIEELFLIKNVRDKVIFIHDLSIKYRYFMLGVSYANHRVFEANTNNPTKGVISIARRRAKELNMTFDDYIKEYGYDAPPLPYDIEILYDHAGIPYQVTIKGANPAPGRRVNKLIIRDSQLILREDLIELSKTFEIQREYAIKPLYPTPANTVLDNPDREEIKKDMNINLVNELKSHLIIMNKFTQLLYDNIGIDISVVSSPKTAASLALRAFELNYPKDYSKIPGIKLQHWDLYHFIRSSLHGGVNSVFKPYGQNLYHYDINSAYPYAAMGDLPGRYLHHVIYAPHMEIKNIYEILLGFHHARVIAPKTQYIGVLPLLYNYSERDETKYPNGAFEGIWTSAELQLALKFGYSITLIESYVFKHDQNKSTFANYIKDIYRNKANSTGPLRNVYKLLLNSLLGRYGIDLERSKSIYLPEYNEKVMKFKPNSPLQPKLEAFKREDKFNFIQMYWNKFFSVPLDPLKDYTKLTGVSNIAYTAMIYSYARVYLLETMFNLMDMGYTIYYCDTDSIVIDKPLPDIVVNNQLGHWKLEREVKEGIYIRPKLYCEVTHDNQLIQRSAGINNTLSYYDYKQLLTGEKSKVQVFKYNTTSNTTRLPHLISEEIKIHSNYQGRDKVYWDSLNTKWIDTMPEDIGYICHKNVNQASTLTKYWRNDDPLTAEEFKQDITEVQK